MIAVGDLAWWDDEILALVLDLDYRSAIVLLALIQDLDGVQWAVRLSDLKPCNNQLAMV